MPRCPSCGTVTGDESHFCPRCGSSLAAPSSPAPLQSWDAPPGQPAVWRQQAQPYGAYGQQWPRVQKTNGLAIASLVLGIIPLCGIGSILAVVFGYMAKNQIDNSGGAESGRGMAIAGIVLGWIWIGVIVLFIVLAIIGSLTDSGSSSQLR